MLIEANEPSGGGPGNATHWLVDNSAWVNASGIGCDWNLAWKYCTVENGCCHALLQQNAQSTGAY
jgi:hypothetical protein